MVDAKRLRFIIHDNGDSQNRLASHLGVTKSTLSFKMNGKSEFRQSEIKAIADRYRLTDAEVRSIFLS